MPLLALAGADLVLPDRIVSAASSLLLNTFSLRYSPPIANLTGPAGHSKSWLESPDRYALGVPRCTGGVLSVTVATAGAYGRLVEVRALNRP